MKNPAKSLIQGKSRGFTLVEILTVIAIISVLMTAGAIGLGNLAAGKGTATALSASEALFDEAKTLAISKQCSARVMIDVDDPKSENFLRRIVIVHQKINEDGEIDPNVWVLANRGYLMPQGTFFSQTYSQGGSGSNAFGEDTISPVSEEGKSLPKYNGKYVYYEFNRSGIFADPGTNFVIGSGVRPNSAKDPRTTASSARDFAGFVIWRNGNTSTFRSPEQIPDVSSHAVNGTF